MATEPDDREQLTDADPWPNVRAWVRAHRGRLPRTLAEYSRYPLVYQRAMFGELPVVVRIDLWDEHFARILERADLTAEQAAFIRELREVAPSHIRHGPGDAVSDLGARAKAILGDELAYLAMVALGAAG